MRRFTRLTSLALAVFLVLAACGRSEQSGRVDLAEGTTTSGERARAIADVEAAIATWRSAGITDYSYTIERRCFCPAVLHARVEVEDGVVTSVELLTEGGDAGWARDELNETIDEVMVGLLDGLRWGDGEHEPGPIELEFDPDLGFASEVSVDPILDAVDDEFGFAISDFTVATDETAVFLGPAGRSMTVTVETLEVEVSSALRGLVLGGVLESTSSDGALAATPVVIATGDQTPVVFRGRWCGASQGPAPLWDGSEGVVVSTDQPSMVRCTAGEEIVSLMGGHGRPFDVGVVDGRIVVVVREWGDPDLQAIDLDTGEATGFFGYPDDISSVSYGGGHWLVVTVGAEGGPPGLALLDSSGGRVRGVTFPPPANEGWPITLDDTGTRVAWIEQDDQPVPPDGPSVQLVVWDLAVGAETHRVEVHIADRFPVHVGDIDFSGGRVILNLFGHGSDVYPSHALLVELEGGESQRIELGISNVSIVLASFLTDLGG